MNNAFTQLDQKQKLSNEVIKQLEDSIRNKVLILNQEIPTENEIPADRSNPRRKMTVAQSFVFTPE